MWGPTHLDDREYPRFIKSSRICLQQSEPKMFVKEEENFVSMPFVLSMRPHAHIWSKHVKQGHLVKPCYFTPLKCLMHNQASHTKLQNMLTNSNK